MVSYSERTHVLFFLVGDVNLQERARLQDIDPQAAYRWFREGTLLDPAVRGNSRPMLVAADAVTVQAWSSIGLSVRVPAHDHKAGRDRLGRITPSWPGRPCPQGRRLPAPKTDEVDDDLVRDVTEVLMSFCARLYGRRSARNRAGKALRCAARDTSHVSPPAVT